MTAGSVADLAITAAQALGAKEAEAYAAFALRTRSPLAAAVLARRATGGTHDLGGLRESVPAGRRPRLDGRWGALLARTVALGPGPSAWSEAVDLFEALPTAPDRLGRPAATVYAQLLLRTGRHVRLREVLPSLDLEATDRWCLGLDLANPFLEATGTPDAGAVEDWLAVLAEPFSGDGLEPPMLDASGLPGSGSNPAFRRLRALPTDRVGGDLVTVVMSAYRPDADIFLAVRSVLDQSWQDLELLVVDDASPPGSGAEEVLEEVAALDPRIRILHAPRNGGTYEVRNLALREARGRWMTFHDSDDWTHPRRIEVQVRAIEDDPALLATRTWTLRAYPDLSMTFVGYPPDRLNASSLLFETAPVARLLGGFDATRKSGDMELPQRLRTLVPGSVRDLRHPAPMAITQLRPGSLSRTDAVPGWTRWNRIFYRDAYLEWHDRAAAGRAPALAGGSARPFPLPDPGWAPRPGPEAGAPRQLDVVVLGDLRSQQPTARRTLAVAQLAAEAGRRTGLAPAEHPVPLATQRQPLLRDAMAAVNAGTVTLTHASLADRVGVLVVTDPASLLHVETAQLEVDEVLLVPALPAEDAGWSVAAVDDRVQELFGVLPRWGGPAAVAASLAAVPAGRRLPGPLPVVVPPARTWTGRAASDGGSRPPVVGHHLPDRGAHWPRLPAELLQVYPDDGSVDAHFLHGVKTPSRVLRRTSPPASWLSYAGTGMTPREFLSHLDVFVYQGRWDPEAEVAALEAMAAGLPCVLPPSAADSLAPEERGATVVLTPASGAARAALGLYREFPRGRDPEGRQLVQRRAAAWLPLLQPSTTPSRPQPAHVPTSPRTGPHEEAHR